ncbi:MAG: S1C family serine protease [Alphaproteobacteria bacterium]
MTQRIGTDAIRRPLRRAWLAAVVLALGTMLPAAPSWTQTATELLSGIVKVSSRTADDARTAQTLGTEREGYGALIDSDGHVLTIGYVVVESDEIRLTGSDGKTVPAKLVAYDHNTGFGLVRAIAPLAGKPLRMGDSDMLRPAQVALSASHGGAQATLPVRVVSRRTFAGYWEYLLEQGIFTVPPIPTFAGAALLNAEGQLIGVGSLIVENAVSDEQYSPGNLFIPINAVKPILADMLQGRRSGPNHPWLGLYTDEMRGRLFVQRLAKDGPAAKAGIVEDELVLAVAGQKVTGLADFYRKLWALGQPGVKVPLTLLSLDGNLHQVTVDSIDRYGWLRPRRSD